MMRSHSSLQLLIAAGVYSWVRLGLGGLLLSSPFASTVVGSCTIPAVSITGLLCAWSLCVDMPHSVRVRKICEMV
jgi:hypothetical protein